MYTSCTSSPPYHITTSPSHLTQYITSTLYTTPPLHYITTTLHHLTTPPPHYTTTLHHHTTPPHYTTTLHHYTTSLHYITIHHTYCTPYHTQNSTSYGFITPITPQSITPHKHTPHYSHHKHTPLFTPQAHTTIHTISYTPPQAHAVVCIMWLMYCFPTGSNIHRVLALLNVLDEHSFSTCRAHNPITTLYSKISNTQKSFEVVLKHECVH